MTSRGAIQQYSRALVGVSVNRLGALYSSFFRNITGTTCSFSQNNIFMWTWKEHQQHTLNLPKRMWVSFLAGQSYFRKCQCTLAAFWEIWRRGGFSFQLVGFVCRSIIPKRTRSDCTQDLYSYTIQSCDIFCTKSCHFCCYCIPRRVTMVTLVPIIPSDAGIIPSSPTSFSLACTVVTAKC